MLCAIIFLLHVCVINSFQDATYSLWSEINFLLQTKLCYSVKGMSANGKKNKKSTRGILNKVPSGTKNKLSKLSPTPSKQTEKWASDPETSLPLPKWRLRPTQTRCRSSLDDQRGLCCLSPGSLLSPLSLIYSWSQFYNHLWVRSHSSSLPFSFWPNFDEPERSRLVSPAFTLRIPHMICCVASQTR